MKNQPRVTERSPSGGLHPKAERRRDAARVPARRPRTRNVPATEYEFWRLLREEFRALPDGPEALWADWTSAAWNEEGHQWCLSGMGDQRSRDVFAYLAERAALGLGHRGGAASLQFWLDRVKSEGRNYRTTCQSWNTDAKDTETEHSHGRIDHLAGAAADYCEKLMNEALKSGLAPAAEERKPETGQGAVPWQSQPLSPWLKRRRREILKRYRSHHGLTMADAARTCTTAETALYAMVRGDKTRYGSEALARVLEKIGVSLQEWNGD